MRWALRLGLTSTTPKTLDDIVLNVAIQGVDKRIFAIVRVCDERRTIEHWEPLIGGETHTKFDSDMFGERSLGWLLEEQVAMKDVEAQLQLFRSSTTTVGGNLRSLRPTQSGVWLRARLVDHDRWIRSAFR